MKPKRLSRPWACFHCSRVVRSRDTMRRHLLRVHKKPMTKWDATVVSYKQFDRVDGRMLPLLSITQEPNRFFERSAKKRRASDLSLWIQLFDKNGDPTFSFGMQADLYDRKHRLPAFLRDLAIRVIEPEQMMANAEYNTSGALEREMARRKMEEKR